MFKNKKEQQNLRNHQQKDIQRKKSLKGNHSPKKNTGKEGRTQFKNQRKKEDPKIQKKEGRPQAGSSSKKRRPQQDQKTTRRKIRRTILDSFFYYYFY